MAITYFGLETGSEWDEAEDSALVIGNHPTNAPFTCPGSGPQNVKALEQYCRLNSGSGSVRLAIYAVSDSSRKAQGSALVPVSGAGAWWGHDAAGITQDGTLTGGATYAILVATNSDTVEMGIIRTGTSLSRYKAGVDYTGGFPATYPGNTNSGWRWMQRCGVEPAVDSKVIIKP